MTKSTSIKVEVRMILNPVRDDRTTSVSEKYIKPNTVIELTSVSINYVRNGIPTATATVAMGRKNASDFRVAIGHPQVRLIVRQVDVLIEAKLEGRRSDKLDWPSEFFTIFDGFTSGVGLKRAEAEGSYQIQMTHWLGHLMESSALSERLHPSAPGWAFTGFNNTKRKGDTPNTDTLGNKIFDDPSIQFKEMTDDLWGKLALPFLTAMAEDDRAYVSRLDALGAPAPEASNRSAFKALKRILVYDFEKSLSQVQTQEIIDERVRQEDDRDRERKRLEFEREEAVEGTDQTPQPVAASELPDVQSENEISDALFGDQVRAANDAREIPMVPVSLPKVNSTARRILSQRLIPCEIKRLMIQSTHINDTFWGRILRFVAKFQLSIVPAVNAAAVVPAMMHGTRSARVVISAEEIFQVTGSGTTDRIPRGVALYSRAARSVRGQLGGGGLNVLPTASVDEIGKYDLKKSLEKELKERKDLSGPKNRAQREALKANAQVASQGTWLFRVAPMWLDYDSCVDGESRITIRRNGKGDVQISAASGIERPLIPNDGKRVNDVPPDILRREAEAERQFIGDRFARWMFLDEAFQRRVAVLNGRFRVDIMPGSTVQFSTMGINITDLPFVSAYSGRLQGTVNQVTLTLDAENAIANTTLMMSHIRNESEIASETFSPIRHPVFNQAWLGGPLVATFEGNRLLSLFNDSEPIPFEEQQRANTQPLTVSEKLLKLLETTTIVELPASLLTQAEKTEPQIIPPAPRPGISEGVPLP